MKQVKTIIRYLRSLETEEWGEEGWKNVLRVKGIRDENKAFCEQKVKEEKPQSKYSYTTTAEGKHKGSPRGFELVSYREGSRAFSTVTAALGKGDGEKVNTIKIC